MLRKCEDLEEEILTLRAALAAAQEQAAQAERAGVERAAKIAEVTAMNKHQVVRRIIGPTILLSGGAYFDFEAPESSAFTIEDVAHGLSMICRFAGHCARFYSVAQHSVHCSELVAPEHAYAALMHDAAEAFVGDVAKPLKVMLPDYKRIEDRVERVVFDRFAIPYPLPAEVKEQDIIMLATEQRQLMHNRDDWDYTRGRRPAAFVIPTWSPEQAKARFLERYAAVRP